MIPPRGTGPPLVAGAQPTVVSSPSVPPTAESPATASATAVEPTAETSTPESADDSSDTPDPLDGDPDDDPESGGLPVDHPEHPLNVAKSTFERGAVDHDAPVAAAEAMQRMQAADAARDEQLHIRDSAGAPSRPILRKAGADAPVETAARNDPDFYSAESISHAMGYARSGQPTDPDLEAQLLEELHEAGVNLDQVRLSYEKVEEKDRERFRLVKLQIALRTTLEHIQDLTAAADARLRFQLDTTNVVRVNLLKQAQSVFLLFDSTQSRLREMVDDVAGQTKALDASHSALQRKFERLDQLVYDIEERASAMREEIRLAGAEIRGAGPALQRLVFLASLGGGIVGAFFGFVVMLCLWLVMG